MNFKISGFAGALTVCLVPGLARAQYIVETDVRGWSEHSYNVGHTGSYTNTAPNSTAFGTTDSTGTAYSAFSQTFGTPPPSGSYTHASTMDNIFGSADLATATVRNIEYDTAQGPSYIDSDGGTAFADFADTLTFNIAGATPTTLTNILVTFTQTGHLVQTGTFAQGNGETFGTLTIGSNGLISSGARIRSIVQLNSLTGYLPQAGMDSYPSANPTFNVISATSTSLVATEVLTLRGASITVPIDFNMNTIGQGMNIDYAATVALGLPAGVTLSSSSGVFGVRPVPEPSAFAALGIGAIALLRRRRA